MLPLWWGGEFLSLSLSQHGMVAPSLYGNSAPSITTPHELQIRVRVRVRVRVRHSFNYIYTYMYIYIYGEGVCRQGARVWWGREGVCRQGARVWWGGEGVCRQALHAAACLVGLCGAIIDAEGEGVGHLH